jgi:hypothetical protein
MENKNLPDFVDPNLYPDFWEQMKGFAEFTGKQIRHVSNGNELFVSEETKIKRVETCNSCDFFDSRHNRCRKCGCFMEHKVKFQDAQCPIKLW